MSGPEGLSRIGVVTTCNVKGLADEKLQHFKQCFFHSKLSFIQEVHGTSERTKHRIERLGFQGGIFSLFNSRARGAALLWKEEFRQVGDGVTDDDGRVAGATLQLGVNGPKVSAISAYAPTLNSSSTTWDEYAKFMDSLEKVMQELQAASGVQNVIIGGDFNQILDKELDSLSETPKTYAAPRDRLLEFLFREGLSDTFRLFNPTEKSYTYERTTGRYSNGKPKKAMNRLDYIFVTDNVLEEVVQCKHRHLGMTDHRAVEASMVVSELSKEWKGLWRHNDLLNSDPEFVEGMQIQIREACGIASRDGLTPHGCWEYVKGKAREYSRKVSIARMKGERKEKQDLLDSIESADPRSEEHTILKEKLEKILRTEGERWIFRSKMRWVEENEASTKFFFMRVKANREKSNISSLLIEEEEITDQKIIQEKIQEYYKDLLNSAPHTLNDSWLRDLPTLRPESKGKLEREVTLAELEKSLFSMQQGKSPGNDGLTVGFLRTFWPQLKEAMWRAMQHSIAEGILSPSQQQSVIRLILKKGKDPKRLEGWRPISLMNNDVKILSAALAARLRPLLPEITSVEQGAFIEDRVVHEGVRLVDQVIQTLESQGSAGRILAVDLRKAFDTVEHDYLLKVMDAMGIGPYFTGLIRTLYRGATSSVLNNGTATGRFVLSRSCRQGDPISPFLFLLAIEPLLIALKSNLDGVKTRGGTAKIAAFADDITVFLGGSDDVGNVLGIVDRFSEVSGLKINRDKSELMSFGSSQAHGTRIQDVNWFRITGVILGKSAYKGTIEKLNFEPAVAKVQNKLNLWKIRHLTVVGRVIAAKAHGLSQVQFLASCIPVPEWCTKQLGSIIYRFIWKGPDKITRLKAAKAWAEGGVTMPLLDNLFAAASIHWFRRVQNNPNRLWAKNITAQFLHIGGLNAGSYTCDLKRLVKEGKMDPFAIHMLQSWIRLQSPNPQLQSTSPVWYNLLLKTKKVGRKPQATLSCHSLSKLGFLTVADFVDADGRLIQGREAIAGGLPPNVQHMWQKVVRILQPAIRGRRDIRGIGFLLKPKPQPEEAILKIGNTTLNASKLTQSLALKAKAHNAVYVQSNTQLLLTESLRVTQAGWDSALASVRTHSNYTKKRDFLFRLYSCTLYSNKSYCRFGHKQSAKCSFCPAPTQTLLHLLIDCPEVVAFRDRIAARWPGEAMTPNRWVMGHEDVPNPLEKAKDFIAREAMMYIHRANWEETPLSLNGVRGALRAIQKLEYAIAEKNDRLITHLRKWDVITPLIDSH